MNRLSQTVKEIHEDWLRRLEIHNPDLTFYSEEIVDEFYNRVPAAATKEEAEEWLNRNFEAFRYAMAYWQFELGPEPIRWWDPIQLKGLTVLAIAQVLGREALHPSRETLWWAIREIGIRMDDYEREIISVKEFKRRLKGVPVTVVADEFKATMKWLEEQEEKKKKW